MKKIIFIFSLFFVLTNFSFAKGQYTIKKFEIKTNPNDENVYDINSSFEKRDKDGVVTKDQRTRSVDKKDFDGHRIVFNDNDADFNLVENKEATKPAPEDKFDEDFSYSPREVYDEFEEFERDFDNYDYYFYPRTPRIRRPHFYYYFW